MVDAAGASNPLTERVDEMPWLFSSTHGTTAFSGGFRYSPNPRPNARQEASPC